MKQLLKVSLFAFLALLVFDSCKKSKEASETTGWNYNDAEWGGFEKLEHKGQIDGPNLVLVQGGTFTMGVVDQDVLFRYNNIPRRVTVSSFYMDETEVANIDYREYMWWLQRVFAQSYPEVYFKAVPDSLVWREELAYNEPFVETYFRHASYNDYPVVGVSWLQANDYSKWRTDRVNEMLLIKKGVLQNNPEQQDEDNFNTEAYLVGQYEGIMGEKGLKDATTGEPRRARFEDGIMLPSYRLPTEAEWEYAAVALQGKQQLKDERISDRRMYPWDGTSMRYQRRGKYQGEMLANFKRGRGDYMGMAGRLNDNAHITAPVRSYMPNDFGLFNMAGNVSEWVLDVYRPLTSLALEDAENHDLNPFRGHVFEQRVLDEEGKPVEKDSLGRIRYEPIRDEDVAERMNYKRANVVDYLDGDKESEVFYNYGVSTLINDKSRVVKGGSWADRAYYMAPGNRRFLDEDRSAKTIGFRCAMTRMGGPQGNDDTGGHQFPKRYAKKKKKRKY